MCVCVSYICYLADDKPNATLYDIQFNSSHGMPTFFFKKVKKGSPWSFGEPTDISVGWQGIYHRSSQLVDLKFQEQHMIFLLKARLYVYHSSNLRSDKSEGSK